MRLCFVWVGMVLCLLALWGCGSSGGRVAEGTEAIESLVATRAALDRAGAEVDRVLSSMDALEADGGDLRREFQAYSEAVDDIEATGRRAADRHQAMRERANAYVARWQQEIDTLQDPSVREGLIDRRETVRARFAEVQDAAGRVREAYGPFLMQLQEMRRALAIDLTPQNVRALAPAFATARERAATLKENGAALRAALDKVSAETSPTAPAAAR